MDRLVGTFKKNGITVSVKIDEEALGNMIDFELDDNKTNFWNSVIKIWVESYRANIEAGEVGFISKYGLICIYPAEIKKLVEKWGRGITSREMMGSLATAGKIKSKVEGGKHRYTLVESNKLGYKMKRAVVLRLIFAGEKVMEV